MIPLPTTVAIPIKDAELPQPLYSCKGQWCPAEVAYTPKMLHYHDGTAYQHPEQEHSRLRRIEWGDYAIRLPAGFYCDLCIVANYLHLTGRPMDSLANELAHRAELGAT